jgi:acetyltransferase-like isoleucine patch superfamily enzyme
VRLLFILIRAAARIAGRAYGGEGINIPLMFMPTQLISPVLQEYGAQVGERVRFRSPLTIHNSDINSSQYYRNLTVGSDCYFGRELFLDLQDRIVIGNDVTISHRVMIMTHTDAGTSPLKDEVIRTSQAAVVIGRGAYIGAQVTILEGVEVGECAVIGAGAVVTKSVPPYSVYAGVPAKQIKTFAATPAELPAGGGERGSGL